MTKKKIAVIFGGKSGEHEVSLLSATSVIRALDKSKYEVLPIYISHKGQWLLTEGPRKLNGHKEMVYLSPDPRDNNLIKIDPQPKEQGSTGVDVVFPVLHGTFGEDGTIQGLLELANLPYVGAGVLGSAVGMDKGIMKTLFKAEGLPVVHFKTILRKEISLSLVKALEKEFDYPFFVKPANLGSSVGISKVHSQQELLPALKVAALYDRKLLIEEGVPDAREIELSVLGNDEPIVSVAGEVVPSNEFYDYDAKYVDGKSKAVIPAPLPKEIARKVQDTAVESFKLLDGAGMARVDFLVKKEGNSWKIYLSELNTIPGFTSIIIYPKIFAPISISY